MLGGGYVGCELGQFFARIGVPTTIVIRARALLSGNDADVGDGLTAYYRAEGIDVEIAGAVLRVGRGRDGRKVVHYLQDGVDAKRSRARDFLRAGARPERRRPRVSMPPACATIAMHRHRGRRDAAHLATAHLRRRRRDRRLCCSSTSRSSKARSRRATRCATAHEARRLPHLQDAYDLHRSRKSRSSASPRRSCRRPASPTWPRAIRSTITVKRSRSARPRAS